MTPYCQTCGRFTGHWPGCDFGLREVSRGAEGSGAAAHRT